MIQYCYSNTFRCKKQVIVLLLLNESITLCNSKYFF